jgi:hypothetical protein
MYAAITGTEELRAKLQIDLQTAIGILWKELLLSQHVYFPKQTAQCIIDLVQETQDSLKSRVLAGAQTKDYDLEIYTLLETLRHPAEHRFRISMPGVTLINEEEKRNVNEYDVLSLVLTKDGKMEVWIWGVTTEQDWRPKREKDMVKIQALRDRLGSRWTGEVRTVGNYIHVDGGKIWLEIDGVQKRR